MHSQSKPLLVIKSSTSKMKPKLDVKPVISKTPNNIQSTRIQYKLKTTQPKRSSLNLLYRPLQRKPISTKNINHINIKRRVSDLVVAPKTKQRNAQKNDLEYIDSLVNKYQRSELKKMIIMDNEGNNNLEISRNRIKSNQDLINVLKVGRNSMKMKTQVYSSHDISSSLFDTGKNKKERRMKTNMIIFDRKQMEEIENTTVTNDKKNDSLSLDTSNISISTFNENDKTIDQNENVPLPLFSPRDLLKSNIC